MLWRLQKKTLIPAQIIGYSLTLCIGMSVILITIQLFLDVKPLLYQQSEVFKSKTAVISKNVSIFKTADKNKIYFTETEFEELKNQSFTKNLSKFNSATFKINAYSKKTQDIPIFYTDLFFESIPDKYLDVITNEWMYDITQDFIPIIIPENYLNLYNFGFAESQGLPVLSKNTISTIEFNIEISGNQKSKNFKSKIVGFSNKINSILVPEKFLLWANKEFGRVLINKTSRVLIEFNNPSDEAILKYFNEKNYSIDKEKLEFSKLLFFFKSALIFVFLIAIIIIILSVAFILLSVNLIMQKNKELILNLYNIGYSYKKIAMFYQITISSITLISIIIAIIISNLIRNYYLIKFINLFDFTVNKSNVLLFGGLLILILVLMYNVLLIRNIKKIVVPRNDK
tara:strand:- start:124 stop:1320 length:1197 start_codon:yes stop_codon:yes gene_type:complete